MMFIEIESVDLTTTEAKHLAQLEATIEAGLQTFVDVGRALLEIRDARLYRQSFDTFEDYCRDRWGMSRIHAHRMIEAANVTNNLLPTGNILPTSERQARPLASIEPEQQREAWQRAVDTAPNGKVTAAHVQSVVNGFRAPAPVQAQQVAPVPTPLAVHYSSETPEHYTPATILDAVVRCLDGIDLDPCSNSHDTPNVPAAKHYTREDDGLRQLWRGRVFMNPPYGREIDDWVAKLVDEFENGGVTEAIALVPARTDTQWWQRLRDYHVCFVTGRLKFIGNVDPAPFPSAVFYLGGNTDMFVNVFEDFGDIWHRTRHGYCFGE